MRPSRWAAFGRVVWGSVSRWVILGRALVHTGLARPLLWDTARPHRRGQAASLAGWQAGWRCQARVLGLAAADAPWAPTEAHPGLETPVSASPALPRRPHHHRHHHHPPSPSPGLGTQPGDVQVAAGQPCGQGPVRSKQGWLSAGCLCVALKNACVQPALGPPPACPRCSLLSATHHHTSQPMPAPPRSVENLYFSYLFVLRAAMKAAPILAADRCAAR